jgi:hypothetical protein
MELRHQRHEFLFDFTLLLGFHDKIYDDMFKFALGLLLTGSHYAVASVVTLL